MTKERKIINSLKNLEKKQYSSYSGKVKSVDLTEQTAVVEIDKNYELPGVRLKSLIDNKKEAILIVPKVGSNVLISFIEQSKNDAFILKYSEIENIDIKIGNVEYKINENGTLLKNGKHVIESDSVFFGSEINAEKSVKGQTFNNLLTEILTHLQTLNGLLIIYGTTQAAELPVISPSNTALQVGMTIETPKLAQIIAKMNLHLSNKVKIA